MDKHRPMDFLHDQCLFIAYFEVELISGGDADYRFGSQLLS